MTIDEAIKHCEKVAENKENEYRLEEKLYGLDSVQCLECANEHRQLAEWLKELKELREQTRWIPVSERLPDNNENVIVTDDAGGLATVGIDWLDGDNGRWWYSQNVTAWMPLPEPYREIKHTCTDCIIKDTDACARGNTEADEVACEDFVDGKEEET